MYVYQVVSGLDGNPRVKVHTLLRTIMLSYTTVGFVVVPLGGKLTDQATLESKDHHVFRSLEDAAQLSLELKRTLAQDLYKQVSVLNLRLNGVLDDVYNPKAYWGRVKAEVASQVGGPEYI